MDKFSFSNALEEVWVLVRRANKYVDEKMPWVLAKDESQVDSLNTCMHHLAEALRVVSILIYPFMHSTTMKIREQIGIDGDIVWEDAYRFDMMAGLQVRKGDAIFPRLDIEKELAELEALKPSPAETEEKLELKPEIEFDDFDKIDMRVGTILEAAKHKDAKKLLVFKVKLGTETRQIVSGVAEHYKPEEMVGKKVVVVANLKPRKIRGEESNGMIIFADGDKKLELVTTEAPDGNPVC